MAYGIISVDTIAPSGNLTVTGNVIINGNLSSNTLSSNNHVFNTISLGTATAGTLEYDGKVPYFTPQGTQRGLIPGMQFYRLETNTTGNNVTTPQSWFNGSANLAVTLSSSTIYNFEAFLFMYRTGAATTHTVSSAFGGTSTINNIVYHITNVGSSSAPPQYDSGVAGGFSYSTAASPFTTTTTTTVYRSLRMTGSVSINTGGTFIPQYVLSAAPGSGYTLNAGSYFLIYPVGVAGSNTSIGTWA